MHTRSSRYNSCRDTTVHRQAGSQCHRTQSQPAPARRATPSSSRRRVHARYLTRRPFHRPVALLNRYPINKYKMWLSYVGLRWYFKILGCVFSGIYSYNVLAPYFGSFCCLLLPTKKNGVNC